MLLNLLIFIPLIGALAILLGFPARKTALGAGAATFLLSVFALLSYDKAAGGKPTLPNADAVIAALRNMEFDSPSGFKVKMALANGHQAIQPTAYGTYAGWDKSTQLPILKDVKFYAAECVNPPVGVTSPDWIKSGLKGAKCD